MTAASLPRLLVLADVSTGGGRLRDIVATAVDCGARGVLLRARSLATADRVSLAADLRRLLAPVDGLLIVAGGGGDAVHLAAQEPLPTPRPSLVGRSCHDAVEVDRAAAEGCDYVFVSPIYPTESKPGYGPALGPTGLAALTRPGLATFALGGVLPAQVAECVGAGAHGVAVMGPIMREPQLVTEYLSALSEVTTA